MVLQCNGTFVCFTKYMHVQCSPLHVHVNAQVYYICIIPLIRQKSTERQDK